MSGARTRVSGAAVPTRVVPGGAESERRANEARHASGAAHARVPRLGFLGVGWIGRTRLESLVRAGLAEPAALADPCHENLAACEPLAPGALLGEGMDDLLGLDLDGLVIATPSALHATQAERALQEGLPVFCQKPLGRSEAECLRVVESARAADLLLGVDFCYRHTRAARVLKALVRAGEIGRIHAMDLSFHNAYGPDKPWFYERRLAGGGCLLDLGIHLVDLALWLTDERSVVEARGTLLAGGRPLSTGGDEVEDYATAELTLGSGVHARIACSWNLHAGTDASIAVRVYGSGGGCGLENVGGSFYDFRAERYERTTRRTLAEPPDPWGGRSLAAWVRGLTGGASYDPRIESVVEVARTLDRVYAT